MLGTSIDLFASISTQSPFCDGIQAVIFDCDGVLVDTEYLKFLAWQKALNHVNIELSIEEYKTLAGHNSKKIVELLRGMKAVDIPDEVIHLRRMEYQGLQAQGVPPLREMVDLVHHLSQRKTVLGIKLGLASSASKKEILFNLKQVGLEQVFDTIISGVDDLDGYWGLEGKNKPKPYIYIEASKRLNIPPERCLVFEDTEAGIEAAIEAGMIAVAIPNEMTAGQNFSKAKKVINSISEFPLEISNAFKTLPFKVDEDLERDPKSYVRKCLRDFFDKGGTLKSISSLSELTEPLVRLNAGDAIYPMCSGGLCRSQALWAILLPFSDHVILFPPHAARHGWDPYNGQINRYRNDAQESIPDAFRLYYGIEKALRFGFENLSEWKSIEQAPTHEGLKKISQFYDQYYFGPHSSWQGRQGNKRVYIAFSNNAHVALYRLNQTNERLEGVTLIAVEAEDLITYPPNSLNTISRSTEGYEHFSCLLWQLFDLSALKSFPK